MNTRLRKRRDAIGWGDISKKSFLEKKMPLEPWDVMAWVFVGVFVHAAFSESVGTPLIQILRKRKFYKVISKGIENSSINTLGDVINVHKGIFPVGKEKDAHKTNLSVVLHECLSKIVSDSDRNSAKAAYIKKRIEEFLNEAKQTMPYWELPLPERNCLHEIHELVDNNDSGAIRVRLKDLAGLIKTKEDTVTKLTKRSRAMTIAGIVLTIIFGVLSLF